VGLNSILRQKLMTAAVKLTDTIEDFSGSAN
jgi:hypothetical protein